MYDSRGAVGFLLLLLLLLLPLLLLLLLLLPLLLVVVGAGGAGGASCLSMPLFVGPVTHGTRNTRTYAYTPAPPPLGVSSLRTCGTHTSGERQC